MHHPILVFGTICIDRVRRVPRLPAPGGYVEILDEQLLLGGEAANTANALHSWGVPVRLCGNSLGEGESAERLRAMLEHHDLETKFLESRGGQTPICDIYVTPDGERTMFGKGFSSMAAYTEASAVPYAEQEWFTAEPNLGAVAREAVRLAHLASMKVYTMDFIRDDDPIEPGSFWQCSTDWVGHRGDIRKNLAWVQRFVEARGCFGILTDGPHGFIAGSPEVPVRHFEPFPVSGVVDFTGAGDLFRAGMLFGLNQSWDIERCLRFASAAGALSCRGLGATTYVPSVEEIGALAGRQA